MSTTGSQGLSDTSKSALQARALPVIGMSGARCSTPLKILGEDCESFDGLPASLVPALIDGAAANRPATAARVDRPARCFRAEPALDPLANRVLSRGRGLRVFFVDSDDDRFECRYTETLRSHPLAGDRPVMDGIRPERQMLSALRDRADLLIDTSLPTAPVAERPFAVGLAVADGGLRVFVTSFACLRGTLRAAYLLSGVGRPENRGHVEVSRALTGTDPAVRELRKEPRLARFFDERWRRPEPSPQRCKTGSKNLFDDCCGPHQWPTPFGLCRPTAAGKAA